MRPGDRQPETRLERCQAAGSGPSRRRRGRRPMSNSRFEACVAAAIESLPPFIRERMENIEVVVERWPSRARLRAMGIPFGGTLLGLYEGIPLTERNSGYQMVPPDLITLFQGPLEALGSGNETAVCEHVRHTLMHEVAHHFGISDERLIELDVY